MVNLPIMIASAASHSPSSLLNNATLMDWIVGLMIILIPMYIALCGLSYFHHGSFFNWLDE